MVTSRPWHVPGKWYISPLTVDVAGLKPEQPARVHIKDDTLREGEETPKVVFTNRDRIEIVQRLDEIGVEEIEMPIGIAPEELKELGDAIRDSGVRCVRAYFTGGPGLVGVRWKEHMKQLVDQGAQRLMVAARFPTPEGLPSGEPSTSVEETLDGIRESVGYAKTLGVKVAFAAPQTTRAPLELVKRYHTTAVEAGADRVQLYDSLGVGTPLLVRYLVSEVKKVVGEVQILWHGHNDLGMATANTIAAVEGGAEWCDVVMNGLGDRAGNAALEEVVVGLEVLCGVKTGIRLDKLYEFSKWLQERSGVKLQPNKAVVGENAFLEESALHYLMTRRAEALGAPEASVPYAPELVGQTHHLIVGSTTLYGAAVNYLLDLWGFKYSDEQVEEIRRVASRQVLDRKYIEEDELRKICETVLGTS